jgi:hypothetical protein
VIAGVVRHARTSRDAQALEIHLLKSENNPRVHVLAGTLATDLSGVLADMQRLRDATSADAAALHIHLSPSRSMSDAELIRAADIVISHFEADGFPAALVIHDKERLDGEGDRHGHLVLGRVSPELQVLESGFEKIRLETAARIIEFELGEEPTLGRHHKSAIKWLASNGRKDIADWLEHAHGREPEKPQSAVSPDGRQGLARKGIDLPTARQEIRNAWALDGAQAIRDAGYEIAAGRKVGVFIVSKDGIEIGSLDRLLAEKRAVVRAAMEAEISSITAENPKPKKIKRAVEPVEARSANSVGDPSPENCRYDQFSDDRSRILKTGTGAANRPAGIRGKKPRGAELVSEAAAQAGRRLAESLEDVFWSDVKASEVKARNRTSNSSKAGMELEGQSVPEAPCVATVSSERSLEKVLASANRFLDRQEAELTEKIAALSRPRQLADPEELVAARTSLKKASEELARWDKTHGSRLKILRRTTDQIRPRGILAWLTGKTSRWLRASRELDRLLEMRRPFLTKTREARRIVRVLITLQETRQHKHEASRERQRERHVDVLELIPHARDVLTDNPRVVLGGGKALARAARARRRRHQATDPMHVPEIEPTAATSFGGGI